MNEPLQNKSVLLIISGGIAAYKSLELIRMLRKAGAHVRCILTNGGAQFVTPLSVAALSEEQVYTDLWSLKDETEMGHIRLSREADLIVVAPASANLIAQMSYGLADDLASTVLLAANKPVLLAPAMNVRMWENAATRENIAKLKARGVQTIGPTGGAMACGEFGMGRMAEPEDILQAVTLYFSMLDRLKRKTALVTAGPTYEPLDPVRFIGNRSSGKQGYAIAKALADSGASVTLVSGPSAEAAPENVTLVRVETAQEMLEASLSALPADIAICSAAVSDWAPDSAGAQKIKKRSDGTPPGITLKENPDILHTLATHKHRPALVIGFAAETENLLEHAQEKLARKRCDWILANDVGRNARGENVFGADENHVYLLGNGDTQDWEATSKTAVALRLADTIAGFFNDTEKESTYAA